MRITTTHNGTVPENNKLNNISQDFIKYLMKISFSYINLIQWMKTALNISQDKKTLDIKFYLVLEYGES